MMIWDGIQEIIKQNRYTDQNYLELPAESFCTVAQGNEIITELVLLREQ